MCRNAAHLQHFAFTGNTNITPRTPQGESIRQILWPQWWSCELETATKTLLLTLRSVVKESNANCVQSQTWTTGCKGNIWIVVRHSQWTRTDRNQLNALTTVFVSWHWGSLIRQRANERRACCSGGNKMISLSLIFNYSCIGFKLVNSLSTQVHNKSHNLLPGCFLFVLFSSRFHTLWINIAAKESQRRTAFPRSSLVCLCVDTGGIKRLIYMLKRFHHQHVFTHLCLAE